MSTRKHKHARPVGRPCGPARTTKELAARVEQLMDGSGMDFEEALSFVIKDVSAPKGVRLCAAARLHACTIAGVISTARKMGIDLEPDETATKPSESEVASDSSKVI